MKINAMRLLLGISVLLTNAACEQVPEQAEASVRPVRYERVQTTGVERSPIFPATVQSALEADLSFKVGGTLLRLDARIGDTIAAGSVIAEIDATDYRVQLQEAEAGLARAQAEERNARAQYSRTQALYENRNATIADLDAARAGAESAKAQVNAVRQQLEAARLQLSYSRLHAPQRCTVNATHVEVNQNVSPGQGVVTLDCGTCPEVLVSVPAAFVGGVDPGSDVTVDINALGNEPLRGIVAEVGASADLASSYPVIVALQEKCDGVLPGMAADVQFNFSDANGQAQLLVPLVSVGEDREGHFVFVLEPAEDDQWVAQRRPVTIGDLSPQGIAVHAGLGDGDLIATAGVRQLSDGQRVTLLGATE